MPRKAVITRKSALEFLAFTKILPVSASYLYGDAAPLFPVQPYIFLLSA
ncbi:hypothetical protein HNR48_003578 [Pseudoteredinibacter isoporae]|uniref:Uncharacterized protein n=1 Tax=Pseudoteredinibacter isoporae TaxID=570281 RepID=A0A7X0MX24_9GAMM|nr:hypothetical protein [Pseudoteredinibacter isoporae]